MFKIKKGDTRPRYIVPLVDNFGESDEEAIDLTTAEEVFFIMRKHGTTDKDGEPEIKSAAEITGEAKEGIVQYTWAENDTETVGMYDVEFEIHWEDGGVESVPNEGYFEVEVVESLG